MACCCSVALEIKGYLTLRCSLKLTPRIHSIRAAFCPLLSLEKGEYIGMSRSCHFYFYGLKAFPKCRVSKCETSLKRKPFFAAVSSGIINSLSLSLSPSLKDSGVFGYLRFTFYPSASWFESRFILNLLHLMQLCWGLLIQYYRLSLNFEDSSIW